VEKWPEWAKECSIQKVHKDLGRGSGRVGGRRRLKERRIGWSITVQSGKRRKISLK